MQLTVHTFLSLDGVMQAPGAPDEDRSNGFDQGGWVGPYADAEFGAIVSGWFTHADEFLLGRSTHDDMQSYWSTVTDPDDAIAAALNGLPKHVPSSTITSSTWANTSIITGDVVAAVRELKARSGRELQVHGSWQLVRTLHDAGLVDTYRLVTFPVVLGAGKRLFAEGAAPVGFRVVDTAVTSGGLIHQVLEPRRD
ncbi:dihydrofolate reductase family protein [Pseudonocardia sp. CA-107938]|uniref:dihydrofolate reductase family protein n=1 Tax=Pseudonocardia sp. CA-107938 TaxID=3240021 RepID=UPI003D93467F